VSGSRQCALRGGAAAVLVAAAVALGGGGVARAAVYTVDTCGGGTYSGWAPFHAGAWSRWWNDGCWGPGYGLGAISGTAGGAVSGWRFSAPADTEIAAFRVSRAYVLAGNRPFGSTVYSLVSEGPGQRYYNWIPNLASDPVRSGVGTETASGLTGQTALLARVECGGPFDCTGEATLGVYSAQLDLRDDLSPAIATVSGSLLAAGRVKGTRSLSYAATDRGGGLWRRQLAVDGQARVDGVIDGKDGTCTGGVYRAVVPCRLAASDTLALDTTQLAEGPHDVELAIWDATAVNRTRYGPFQITVDNIPPPASASAPRISGTAAQGVTLVADDGTWTGSGLTFARRWQRYEGGAWQDVADATGRSYVVAAEDAGHRLRVRVRVANAEGAAEAVSEPTAVVAAAGTAPAPTSTPDPAPAWSAPVLGGPAPQPARGGAILTAAFESAGAAAATVRWGWSRRVAGTLRDLDGRPLAGARVDVTSRARVAAAAPVPLPPATTDASGRFGYVVTAGVSRAVTFHYGAAAATVIVRVIPHVTLRAARSGGAVRLAGRVVGAPAGLRKVVELQARQGRAWRTFATTRLAPLGGTFQYRHRTAARRFRTVVRAEPGWPFLTAGSAPARASPSSPAANSAGPSSPPAPRRRGPPRARP
jgi:hypothetical protein